MVIRNGVFSLLVVVSTAIGVTPTCTAPDTQALADKSDRFSCHSMHARIVGPAFAGVAVEYRGNADTSMRLAQRIHESDKDAWGRIPVPAHSNFKEDGAK